ncbi:TadE/TadG family type IV pilus assembly protein [Paraburkholderia bryophila]|jgi:Mg-chelatase subunit ChlD|uniref:Flp pilus assembly protein TadG n=1 Tax=Paraburkholderia bryophila TaxID=420952 RepID=A0A329CI74_9BURK|nr:VWA domain-containing protein [Paraburkholderia bryophila]RAS34606.1 Flp pilus assembly protein TadG [Paraburkholderia bryophila]
MKKIAAYTARQRGSISVIVAVSLIALIGILGLAVDSGLGYMIKARLDAATDGAVIAAGEAVTRGNNQTQQTANAQQAASAFFAANYPVGFLGSTVTAGTPSIVFNAGTVTIGMTAQASVPVTFMQTLGFRILNVSASSQAIRKTLDMAFVIDTTGSLNVSGVPAAVRANAIAFLNNFDVTNDRVALMHFAYGTVVDVPFNGNTRGFNRTLMTTDINAYTFGGSTNSAEAVWNARNQLNTVITQPSSLRVIVFFSDGAPNSFASYFTTNQSSCSNTPATLASPDTAGTMTGLYNMNALSQALNSPCYQSNATRLVTAMPKWYNAHNVNEQIFPIWPVTTPRAVPNGNITYVNVNRASRNLLEAMAAQARIEGTYVFTLGYGPELVQPEGPDNELGSDVLKCMANTPDSLARCYNPAQPVGVYCYAATPNDLKPCFTQLASQILRISK